MTTETDFNTRVAIATAPAWMPQPGDQLLGVEVIDVMEGKTEEYGSYPKVIYRKPDGTYVAFHAFHTIPRERLVELKKAYGKLKGRVHNVQFIGRQTSNSRTDSKGEPQEYVNYFIEDTADTKVVNDEEFDF